MAVLQVAVINESKLVGDDEARKVVAAHQKQISQHFAPEWGRDVLMTFYSKADIAKVPTNVAIHAILDDSDQADALGYHDVTPRGLPLGKTFVAADREHWSVTFSHEGMELAADPYVCDAIQDPTSGAFYALEVCDPCEDNSFAYKVDGVLLSDFITHAWFMPMWRHPPKGVVAPAMDFMKHIKTPLTLIAGGYASVFKNGKWSQITHADKAPPAHKVTPAPGSRQHRRHMSNMRPFRESTLSHMPCFH
jgi:hypothetical protein